MGRIKDVLISVHENARLVNNIAKRSYIYSIVDIIYCGIRYGASPNNYFKFDFYQIPHKLRRTYVTNRINEKLIRKYNQKMYRILFENKVKFAEIFSDLFKREWLNFSTCTKQKYETFVAKKQRIVCKPLEGSQGVGIIIYDNDIPSYEDIKSAFGDSKYIIEAYIKQHIALDAFYCGAVNCIRIITIVNEGKVNPIVANITFGYLNKIANASFGGITAQIDIKTGEIISGGGQYGHMIFEKHPYSGMKIKGFVIPYWNEVLFMLNDAGKRIPQIGYVGWDIAVTEDGPVLIEGNTSPGYTYFQIPQLLENQVGTLKMYAQYL